MPSMDYKDIISHLKKGEYSPVYLLHGEEPYYIDKVSEYISNHVLDASEQAFNQMVLYGKDCDVKEIIDSARQYPMMASHRVMIIKEAQALRGLPDLEHYILKPTGTTILVLCHKHKKLDGRTSFFKAVSKHAIVFESKKMSDNKIPAWIGNYCKAHNHSIEPEAALILSEYLGNDLSKISGELDKLFLNIGTDNTISKNLVFDNIGISREYNVFEFQRALGQKDLVKVQTILKHFMTNPKSNPLIMLISILYGFYSKLYVAKSMAHAGDQAMANAMGMRSTWFVKEYKEAAAYHSLREIEGIIATLAEFDLRSKGMHADHNISTESELMREMIQRIISFASIQSREGRASTTA